MIHFLKPESLEPSRLSEILDMHPEIQFVSLLAVDLGNNHTDEKIPISAMKADVEGFLQQGVQTDGSSVNLPIIAEINNAKVDLIPDRTVKWYIDYNPNNIDEQTGLPVGTLMIPAFLEHEGKYVGSRAVLREAVSHFDTEIMALLKAHPAALKEVGINSIDDIDHVELTTATELEFWVKTPDHRTEVEKLSTSQTLKEQYWKRTVGPVRTALEQSLTNLELMGLESEMGHKEVGGVPSRLKGTNKWTGIMEQLEIDWKYDTALQSTDHELIAKDLIKDTFEQNGLEVTFAAKPIEGVAGSGEHHHLGAALRLKNGKTVNLYAPLKMTDDYMNKFGWGALMGLLKNYSVINPFVTCTNDAFNRLKPGFEAPVCTVASVGHSVEVPSRNRTVLCGLVRDMGNPLATRFELRAPNPSTNSYLAIAASYMAMLDGIRAAVASDLSASDLEKEFNKPWGEDKFYLETDRMYRSEEDVFEDYTSDQRDQYFGAPPATVWENLKKLVDNAPKLAVLEPVFNKQIISSYHATMQSMWTTELLSRIIPGNMDLVRRLHKLHGIEDLTDLDVVNWEKINTLRFQLMKDSLSQKSLFTQIRSAVAEESFENASSLQLEMATLVNQLTALYHDYKQNLLRFE